MHTPDRMVREQAAEELRAGFALQPKSLPPKFFYDERGSALFEQITALPEYYPTRTERTLLEQWVPRWVEAVQPRSVVELGAGSAAKTRIILEAVSRLRSNAAFVPVDISADFLEMTAAELRNEYPDLDIRPLVSDLGQPLQLPSDLPRPALVAFLGSTIGNFAEEDAVALLGRFADQMTDEDVFLIGFDLVKEASILEAAYDDRSGVTAEFNLNMLRVLNALTGSNFDPSKFSHLAFYNREQSRVEMHLISETDQTVTLPDGTAWALGEGETIRTEISCKYERDGVERMLSSAGLRVREWTTDELDYYALALVGR
ncbi:L-histidine N(alpha)-methyltransferase [soil metagenome]